MPTLLVWWVLAGAGAGVVAAGAGVVAAGPSREGAAEVRVERVRMSVGQELTLQVSSAVEYIVDIVTSSSESAWPVRVVSELMALQPAVVVVTARRGAVADTWQLGGGTNATQRTLCAADDGGDNAMCDGEYGVGAWSLHVSAACARATAVRVRLAAATDWSLSDDDVTSAAVSPDEPLLLRYRWTSDTQRSVRVLADSQDTVCVTVAVCNYTCPLPQSLASLPPRCMRMTMLRAAAVYIKRSMYPDGFVVVVLAQESPSACGVSQLPAVPLSEPPVAPLSLQRPPDEWLWDAAMDIHRNVTVVDNVPGVKQITFTIQRTLEGGEYAAASAVTLSVFLAFYIIVGGLLVAYRWQPCRTRLARCVSVGDNDSDTRMPAAVTTQPTTRRHSNATYDGSSDVSESDSDAEGGGVGRDGGMGGAARETEQQSGPFGLPRSLHVDAVSRRHARTLSARARRYRDTLLVVAVFYALPVLQLVAAFQLLLNVSGQLDLCYYNFQCSHPVGALSDFNHVFSNAGYVLLGALFMVHVHARRQRRARVPERVQTGIPPRDGMMDALGAGLMVLGLLSAAYHVCPNRLNFQFDTAFMYVLSLLVLATLHAGRHADVGWRAHGVFALLAVLMACVVGGVLAAGPAFWAVWSALHVLTATLLTLKVYYLGQFKLEGWREAVVSDGGRPRYIARLVVLLLANAANWGFAIYGLVKQPSDFAGHLLSVLLGNALLYLMGYLVNKLVHGERLVWAAWALLTAAGVAWPAALYFFLWGSSDWSTSPALSRERNHPCLLLGFYDAHDLWHMLSAAALYLTFTAMLIWDDDLADVPRDKIPVF